MLFCLCKNIWSYTSWVFQVRMKKRENPLTIFAEYEKDNGREVASHALVMLWTKGEYQATS